MSWLKFDDHFDEHPKVVILSDAAFRLSVRAIAYASRNLTDGALSTAAVRSFVGTKAGRLSAELVAAGLWEPASDGWQIHDYNEYQPTRASVLEQRRVRAEAGRLGGLKSGEVRSKAEAGAKQVASLERSGNEAKANPVPEPAPVPEERASSSLRSVLEDRLATAFTKIGCTDERLRATLLADDAVEIIVDKLELLAEKSGKPGASPTSRIKQYLKACEDNLQEERDRVRRSRTPEPTVYELRHKLMRAGESCGRDECPMCS